MKIDYLIHDLYNIIMNPYINLDTFMKYTFIEGKELPIKLRLLLDYYKCGNLSMTGLYLFYKDLKNGIKPKHGWDCFAYTLLDDWDYQTGGTAIPYFYNTLEEAQANHKNVYNYAIYKIAEKSWILVKWC